MFKCKVCTEKDLRISDLKDQIASLRKMLMPNSQTLTNIEMNSILNANDNVIELNRDQLAEHERIATEANLIISGDY